MSSATQTNTLNIEQAVNKVLATIDREREREIISRRFGLFDRRETLEQIGELLGITRERVRQLEKAVLARLKTSADNGLPGINEVESVFSAQLKTMGSVARVIDLSAKLSKANSKVDQSRVAFLAQLCPKLVVVDENDFYFHLVGLASAHSEKQLKDKINKVVEAVKNIGKPTSIDKIAEAVSDKDEAHAESLAKASKQIATLNNRWGLVKWPMVNPKNIRDKIYVILHDHGKHMHFNEIAKAIKDSDFKRKDVTTQAIHNELIKDKRFVLIGRGIYALKEWGYEKGTVADIITKVLKKSGEPLHRDEIVKQVLKSRYVKETTILLNLQGKSQFKRVAKATYALAE
ncbi:MAG TPA: sigma factor-like helix-turn-helix DNA-binding protein [Candidatus Saccharimonadales bacterium]|nr:sigma factor-like helix-turn-helix DNA-binding protein [Candidatus Saccharimonadales bacterium]